MPVSTAQTAWNEKNPVKYAKKNTRFYIGWDFTTLGVFLFLLWGILRGTVKLPDQNHAFFSVFYLKL